MWGLTGVLLIALSGCASARHGAGGASAVSSHTGPTGASSLAQQAVPVPTSIAVRIPKAIRPVRLVIPAIGVSTSLVNLGIASDGTLDVPRNFQQAGWLATGPAPGQPGPAIIAGHVDSTTGPAVFWRLRDLRIGDAIQVQLADGTVVRFTVNLLQQYAKSRFPTAAVYGPAPGPVLRLITCGGSFDRAVGHYRDNVVVYAS